MSDHAYGETTMVPVPVAQNAVNGSPTQVGDQLSLTPELIDGLFASVAEMEARLVGVLRYPSDQCEPAAKLLEEAPLIVPVASVLANYNDRLRLLRRNIDDIIARLEL